MTRVGAVAACCAIPPTSTSTPQGRIWVTEGVNYRRHKDRDAKGDRVVVLEDTDHDGRADASSVFVQEPTLVAPLGIAVLDNKIIVSNAPDLIVYTDVNRDRKFDPAVDKREVLLYGFRRPQSRSRAALGDLRSRWPLVFQQWQCGRELHRSRRPHVPHRQRLQPGAGWRRAAGVRICAAERTRARSSDDGHVYVGGFSARMQPDGTGVEILGFNFRNSYEQTVTSFGDIFHNDNDDPPACRTSLPHGVRQLRFLLARRQALLAGGSPPGPVDSHRGMAPGRSGRDSVGRCVRRRRADRHRVQRRRRTRQ